MHRLHTIRSTTWLLLGGLVSFVLLSATLFTITTLELLSANEQSELRQLETHMEVAWRLLHDLGPGVSVVDGRLFAGTVQLDGNTELAERIQHLVGGTAAVLRDDLAADASLGEGSANWLGVPGVRETVLGRGEPFRGTVDVAGTRYRVAYDPIVDRAGARVGILHVGSPVRQELAGVGRRTALLLGLPAAASVLIGLLLCLVGRKLDGQVTARRRMLSDAHAHLDTALANMANGLTLWSRDKNLVLFNARAVELYGLPPGALWLGMSFRDLLAARHAVGAFGQVDFEEFYEQRSRWAAQEGTQSFVDMSLSGRVINVLHRPMADGGWVSTSEDVTERHMANAKINFMAHYDSLTGLGNRVLFDQRVNEMLDEAAACGGRVAVLGLDLDRFKPVNDMLGHAAGDKLLAAVAGRLTSVIRAGDFAARLGGDEFGIVMALKDDGPQAHQAVAERIIEQLSVPFTIDEQQVVIGVSIGIALYPADGSATEELLRCADIAMYRSKDGGRNTYRFFEPVMYAGLQERQELERDLRHAIEAELLDLHYQPFVDCDTGAIKGYEALLRWDHEARGPVPPSVFVPLAEETGLIRKLEEWVLETACRTAAAWADPVLVSVNLSPLQFRQHDLAGMVMGALARAGLEPARLELEITEGGLIDDAARAIDLLTTLRTAGIRISLDDFGTGYCSLSYLRQFPLDTIKVDKSFVADIASDPQAASIVGALVSLAHTLNLSVTAKGVETAEQRCILQQQMCDQVQGYLLGRPAPDTAKRADHARRRALVLAD